MLNTQKMVQARLLHLQTNTLIDLPPNLSVIRIGKANSKWLPDIDVSKLQNSNVVSSLHAEIRVQGNNYFIEDLASDFGTYLNQSRLTALTRYELHWGDRVDLGENKQFTLIFQGKRPFFHFSFSRQRQVSVTAIQPKAIENSKQTSATNKPIKKGIVANDTTKLQRGRFGVKRLFWYLFLIGTGYVAAFWVNNFNDIRSRQSSLTEQQTPLTESSEEPAISDENRGKTIYVDDLSITVVEVKSLGKKISGNQFVNFEALGTWQMVVVDVTNTGTSTESLPAHRLALKDASGNTYDISSETGFYSVISGNKSWLNLELPPSLSERFYLLFDVTPGANGFQFIVKGEE